MLRFATFLTTAIICALGLIGITGKCEEITQPAISDSRPLQIVSAKAETLKVPRYGLFEVAAQIQGTYANAFDPDEISVDASVRGPKGETVPVPGFYFQDYTRGLEGTSERLSMKGTPEWRVRYAPTQVGAYTMTITAKDKTGARVESKPIEFRCVASNDPGFVRVSSDDNRYFAFDNGHPYVPVGANICWGSGPRQTYDYDDWLPKYGEAGCNYFRAWLGPGWVTFALERVGEPADRYGVGKFDLSHAWRLDYVLDLATKHGQYVMLCIDSFNELRKQSEDAYPYWEGTPQNIANGGPLKEPVEFWTDRTMQRLYRNKLRYLVARYGWRTHVMSWEFWNEVDIVSSTAYEPEKVADWHSRMSAYIRSIDPWKHLRTTSFAYSDGSPRIMRLPEIDYTQTHNYGSKDIAAALYDWQRRHEVYRKPHYVGEFGCDAGGSDATVDPEGIGLHNGIWSTVMSGSAGAAMSWWWDNHIHPHNLYTHFAALNAFIKGVDFPKEGFKRVGTARFTALGDRPAPTYHDLIINGPVSWDAAKANRPTTLIIPRSGEIREVDQVAGMLHGQTNHPKEHNPLTIECDLPHPTKVHVLVSGISGYGGAHLIIRRDGETTLDKSMPDVNPDGKHDTLNKYDGDYSVDLPSGAHRVAVENTGADWMYVTYRIEKAVRVDSPDLRLFGIAGKKTSLLWVQNPQHTWYTVSALKIPAATQPPSRMVVAGFPSGRYRAEFWDTYTGRPTQAPEATADTAGLQLDLPAITTDIAVRITRTDGE